MGCKSLKKRSRGRYLECRKAARRGVEKALKNHCRNCNSACARRCCKIHKILKSSTPMGMKWRAGCSLTRPLRLLRLMLSSEPAKVDDQGNPEAIRLKRAKSIPWYIHVSMVPKSFEKVRVSESQNQWSRVLGMRRNVSASLYAPRRIPKP